MSTLETTIIATALVDISDLGSFQKSSWVPVTHLLTYAGQDGSRIVGRILVLTADRIFDHFARFSEIFGRKQMLILCVTFFALFSGARGATHTMDQL